MNQLRLPELPLNLVYWHLWNLNIQRVHQSIHLQQPTLIPIRFSWLQNLHPKTNVLIKERISEQLYIYMHSHTVDYYTSYGILKKYQNTPTQIIDEPQSDTMGIFDCDDGLAVYYENSSSFDFIQIIWEGYTCQSPEIFWQLPWKAVQFVLDHQVPVYCDYNDTAFIEYNDMIADDFIKEGSDATLFAGEWTTIKESDYDLWLRSLSQ